MGRSRVHWLCFPFLRVARGVLRSPLSTRTLILATLCGVYLLFLASCVGHSQQHRDGSTDAHRHRQSRGLEPQTGAGSAAMPTRSNVVYITLRFKRLKPANLRATVRPKLRRKVRQENRVASAFTRSAVGTLAQDARRVRRDFAARREAWREAGDVDYNIQSPDTDEVSHIRMYSQRSPQWLSGHDVAAMRFLADARVWRVREVFAHEDSAPLVMFEGDSKGAGTRTNNTGGRDVCAGQCGVIGSPVDTAEVFAFHLDRVLGLNRTLPAVSRSFRVLHDGRPCSVVLWDASLYPGGLAAGRPAVRLTWGGYQRSLKQRCWHKNISPKPDSGCSTIHHYEWSKLALFDFLLQIHSRLDPSCCGFRPRLEDACVGAGRRGDCGDPDHIRLANIVRGGHDPRRLVFTNNKGFFDRNEDNLDFRLLDGITELPEQAVSVLRSRRLREKLLQSLFLDRTYWESQGGRQGIDKLIDVIERRAKVLLTYINAHGIKVVPMHV